MRLVEKIRDYVKKNKSQLTMAGAAAAVVFVAYIVFNLIMWNNANISYALIFALVAFFLYFIVQRLLGYVMTKKEGVIEKKR